MGLFCTPERMFRTEMNNIQHSLNILHDLLVREFRAYQALDAFIQDEHRALLIGHAEDLLEVSRSKSTLLDKLLNIGAARQEALSVLGNLLAIDLPVDLPIVLNHIQTAIDRDRGGRMTRLIIGIQLLMERVRENTCVNQALASATLTQISSSQGKLFQKHQTGAYQTLLQTSNYPLTNS
jgi:flagellar biosynthesis/type III secretory pathway chaperone